MLCIAYTIAWGIGIYRNFFRKNASPGKELTMRRIADFAFWTLLALTSVGALSTLISIDAHDVVLYIFPEIMDSVRLFWWILAASFAATLASLAAWLVIMAGIRCRRGQQC